MSVGYGVGAGIGLGTESTPGTPVSPSVWVPFSSESIAGTRGLVEDSTIYGDRSVKTRNYSVRSGAGNFQMEVDGSNLGLPMFYWNGNAGGAYTVSQLTGFLTAAPNLTPDAGGNLEIGTYRYRVATVWERQRDGKLIVMPSSAEATASAASTDQTITVAWADPTALVPFEGHSVAGTLVYRSEVDGSASTLRLVHFQDDGSTNWTDNGSKLQITSSSPYSAVPYVHTFVKAFQPGSNPLPPFTATVVKDNDKAERYILSRMNSMEVAVGGADSAVTATFDLMARDFDTVANPAITHSVLRKMMGWQTQVELDGEYSEVVEAVTFTGANNCELVPGLRGVAGYRDVGYGQRSITGSFARGFEDHKFFESMRNGCRFNLRSDLFGQHFGGSTCNVENSEITAYPMEYTCILEAFSCAIESAGGNVGGFGRIQETVGWASEVSPATGTDLRVRLINLTPGPYQ